MDEGVTSPRPLLTRQPGGPEELRAGEGMGRGKVLGEEMVLMWQREGGWDVMC